jgi:FAD/FMN-containing dehydrogenase
MNTTTDRATIAQLRAELDSRVITPGDAEYERARGVFYRSVDRRPALIARPATTAKVAGVVSLARDSGLELAVRSGGHSLAGHGVSEGGIVLDLSELRELEIDVRGRTAWVQTGSTAAAYTTATGAHGLATAVAGGSWWPSALSTSGPRRGPSTRRGSRTSRTR